MAKDELHIGDEVVPVCAHLLVSPEIRCYLAQLDILVHIDQQ